jgi:hypothetical protein
MFAKVIGGPGFSRATILALASHLLGGLVPAEADIDRVSQEVVGRPGQIGDNGDEGCARIAGRRLNLVFN